MIEFIPNPDTSEKTVNSHKWQVRECFRTPGKIASNEDSTPAPTCRREHHPNRPLKTLSTPPQTITANPSPSSTLTT